MWQGGGVLNNVDCTGLDMTDDDILDNFRQVECQEIDSYDKFKNTRDNKINSYNILHINIRSYFKNIENLFIVLAAIKVNFDFILLSESWLDNDTILKNLDGYNVTQQQGIEIEMMA